MYIEKKNTTHQNGMGEGAFAVCRRRKDTDACELKHEQEGREKNEE